MSIKLFKVKSGVQSNVVVSLNVFFYVSYFQGYITEIIIGLKIASFPFHRPAKLHLSLDALTFLILDDWFYIKFTMFTKNYKTIH